MNCKDCPFRENQTTPPKGYTMAHDCSFRKEHIVGKKGVGCWSPKLDIALKNQKEVKHNDGL